MVTAMAVTEPIASRLRSRKDAASCAASDEHSSSVSTAAPQGGKSKSVERKSARPLIGGRSDWFNVLGLIAVMGLISYVTLPSTMTTKEPTVYQVWYYGWLAALSTGLGALPLLFMSKPDNQWMSVSNAIAAGMMLSASYSLITEGLAIDDDGLAAFGMPLPHALRVALGTLAGILFVVTTKSWVEKYEDLTLGEDLTGLEAAKVLLIISVMTLHSFAEGLGIGVSFCGKDGAHLGAFISASLAVHNVPEGLAVALVLVPRGVSKFKTFAWSVGTSLPQPIIAVAVYLFVEHFIVWQSVGLGFAAGAMLWVACFELIADAITEISIPLTSFSLSLSFVAMLAISSWIDVVTGHEHGP